MTACPGACNAAWRASSQGEPRHGEPIWCTPCKAPIRAKFADLDYQLAWRAFAADGHHEQAGSPTRHAGGHQSPSQPADDVEEATGWLWDWEDATRKELGLPASYHYGPLPEIRSKVIAWLAERLDTILALPFAADFGREVTERHWELLGKNGARPPRRGLVNCPQCGLRLLAWVDDDRGLVCGHCNRHVTRAEYDDMTARELERAS